MPRMRQNIYILIIYLGMGAMKQDPAVEVALLEWRDFADLHQALYHHY